MITKSIKIKIKINTIHKMKDNRPPKRLPPIPGSASTYSIRDKIENLCSRLRKQSIARERKRVFYRFTFTEEEIFRSRLTPSTIPSSSGFVSDWHFYPTPRTKLISARRLASRISERT
jgi:hypothetical protein